jgi:hypothetical protein
MINSPVLYWNYNTVVCLYGAFPAPPVFNKEIGNFFYLSFLFAAFMILCGSISYSTNIN